MLIKYRIVPHALKKMNTNGIKRSLMSTELRDFIMRAFEYELVEREEIDDQFETKEGVDFAEDLADSCLYFCKRIHMYI